SHRRSARAGPVPAPGGPGLPRLFGRRVRRAHPAVVDGADGAFPERALGRSLGAAARPQREQALPGRGRLGRVLDMAPPARRKPGLGEAAPHAAVDMEHPDPGFDGAVEGSRQWNNAAIEQWSDKGARPTLPHYLIAALFYCPL